MSIIMAPKNPIFFAEVLAARNSSDPMSNLPSIPSNFSSAADSDLAVTFYLVVARDLWEYTATTLNFTAVAFDLQSYLLDLVPFQVSERERERECVCV